MLTIDYLSKKFGQQQVITNLNLQIEKQPFVLSYFSLFSFQEWGYCVHH